MKKSLGEEVLRFFSSLDRPFCCANTLCRKLFQDLGGSGEYNLKPMTAQGAAGPLLVDVQEEGSSVPIQHKVARTLNPKLAAFLLLIGVCALLISVAFLQEGIILIPWTDDIVP